MTVARGLFVLFMMVAVGVAIVILRGESAKAAYRVQGLHQEQIALEQELWAREMELARLRGPDEIRRRAEELGLEVVPPEAPARVGWGAPAQDEATGETGGGAVRTGGVREKPAHDP